MIDVKEKKRLKKVKQAKYKEKAKSFKRDFKNGASSCQARSNKKQQCCVCKKDIAPGCDHIKWNADIQGKTKNRYAGDRECFGCALDNIKFNQSKDAIRVIKLGGVCSDKVRFKTQNNITEIYLKNN